MLIDGVKRNDSRNYPIEQSLNLGRRCEVLRRLRLRISHIRVEDGLESLQDF